MSSTNRFNHPNGSAQMPSANLAGAAGASPGPLFGATPEALRGVPLGAIAGDIAASFELDDDFLAATSFDAPSADPSKGPAFGPGLARPRHEAAPALKTQAKALAADSLSALAQKKPQEAKAGETQASLGQTGQAQAKQPKAGLISAARSQALKSVNAQGVNKQGASERHTADSFKAGPGLASPSLAEPGLAAPNLAELAANAQAENSPRQATSGNSAKDPQSPPSQIAAHQAPAFGPGLPGSRPRSLLAAIFESENPEIAFGASERSMASPARDVAFISGPKPIAKTPASAGAQAKIEASGSEFEVKPRGVPAFPNAAPAPMVLALSRFSAPKAKRWSWPRALGLGGLLVMLSAFLAGSVIYAVQLASDRLVSEAPANRQVIALTPPPPAAPVLDKNLLAELMGPRELPAENAGYLELKDSRGRSLFATTTLDEALQAKALQWISQSGAIRAALVVIDPMTGKVLALAGTDVGGRNSALSGTYPAASVFKMITAAAAVEKVGLSGESVVLYDGSKHTLYKANVRKGVDKGNHKATLRKSFAESVNSVFGKLGAHEIGGEGLAAAADRFGFNRKLGFEMPLEASTFDLGTKGSADPSIPAGDAGEGADSAQGEALSEAGLPAGDAASEDKSDEIFHLAELASGFNRVTKISPVHGALMAAAAINGGILYEPTVIREVFSKQNEVLYQSVPAPVGVVFGEEVGNELRGMMTAAVYEGTGRKQFSDAMDHRILSKLDLGGKSGSINDDTGARVDWFVAFAKPSESGVPPLALAAVVVHQGNTRVSSQELIRRSLLTYYGGKFSAGDVAKTGGKPAKGNQAEDNQAKNS